MVLVGHLGSSRSAPWSETSEPTNVPGKAVERTVTRDLRDW